jgi:hypothetical protein
MAKRFTTDGGTAFVGPIVVLDEEGEVLAEVGGVSAAVATLTDNSGGTASNTIAVIGATYDQAEVRNAVASLAAKVNALIEAIGIDGV